MTVGINVGVPASKKAFRQRLGRVGRASPGTFAAPLSRIDEGSIRLGTYIGQIILL